MYGSGNLAWVERVSALCRKRAETMLNNFQWLVKQFNDIYCFITVFSLHILLLILPTSLVLPTIPIWIGVGFWCECVVIYKWSQSVAVNYKKKKWMWISFAKTISKFRWWTLKGLCAVCAFWDKLALQLEWCSFISWPIEDSAHNILLDNIKLWPRFASIRADEFELLYSKQAFPFSLFPLLFVKSKPKLQPILKWK